MALRKIDLMHRKFGKNEAHECGECSNLKTYIYRDKRYRKCAVYGVTNSEASDWAKRYTACGMFNQEHTGQDIIRSVRGSVAPREREELPGQLTMEV